MFIENSEQKASGGNWNSRSTKCSDSFSSNNSDYVFLCSIRDNSFNTKEHLLPSDLFTLMNNKEMIWEAFFLITSTLLPQ